MEQKAGSGSGQSIDSCFGKAGRGGAECPDRRTGKDPSNFLFPNVRVERLSVGAVQHLVAKNVAVAVAVGLRSAKQQGLREFPQVPVCCPALRG